LRGTTPPEASRRASAVRLLTHPLGTALLTRLRDRSTGVESFRAVAHRLSLLVCAAVLEELAVEVVPVETPLAPTTGARLTEAVVGVPVLRAGLGMLPALEALLPDVTVGYIGLERDEEHLTPTRYYGKLPDLTGRLVVLLDPMLATGGSAAAACDSLVAAGADRIVLACVVAAPEGLAHLGARHPRVAVVAAAVDEGLDARGYIVPGLGDFGDRLFGTRPAGEPPTTGPSTLPAAPPGPSPLIRPTGE